MGPFKANMHTSLAFKEFTFYKLKIQLIQQKVLYSVYWVLINTTLYTECITTMSILCMLKYNVLKATLGSYFVSKHCFSLIFISYPQDIWKK